MYQLTLLQIDLIWVNIYKTPEALTLKTILSLLKLKTLSTMANNKISQTLWHKCNLKGMTQCKQISINQTFKSQELTRVNKV